MKNIITILSLLLSVLACADNAFIIKSVADTSSVTTSRIDSLNDVCPVDYSNTGNLLSANFATRITVPDGTTSMTITALTTTLKRRIGGINLPPTTIGLSRFNPEGDTNKPSILAVNAVGSVVSTTGATVVGTAIPDSKYFYITEYGLSTVTTSAKPVLIGDFYEVVRTFSGTYVLAGVPVNFTNVITKSKIMVVQKKNYAGIIYKTPQATESATGGSFALPIATTSLSVETYLKDWWIEISDDYVGSWRLSTEYGVSSDGSNVIITFPGERRYWQIVATSSNP